MRVFIFGDQAAGKSTFLQMVPEKLYTVKYENLLSKLHPKVYENIVMRRISFALYFFERDIESWHSTRTTFYEYCFLTTYAFCDANLRVGEMTKDSHAAVTRVLDEVSKNFPIEKDDIALHFICDFDISNKRIREREGNASVKTAAYTVAHRESLQNRFRGLCRYHQIDTTHLSPLDVYCHIQTTALPWLVNPISI